MQTRIIRIVTGFELKRALRTPGGVLFLAMFGIIWGWILLRLRDVAGPMAELRTQVGGDTQGMENLLGGVIGWLIDLEPSQLFGLIKAHSPLMLLYFYLGLALTPTFALMASFEQTSTDISTRHLRFVLLRADRGSYFMGKISAALGVYALAIGATTVAACVMSMMAGGGIEDLFYGLRIWITLVLYAVPFVCLSGFSAAATGHPALSLLLSVGYIFLVWMIAAAGSLAVPVLKNLAWLSPTLHKNSLLLDTFGDWLLVGAHVGAFTAVALGVGLFVFSRRDV